MSKRETPMQRDRALTIYEKSQAGRRAFTALLSDYDAVRRLGVGQRIRLTLVNAACLLNIERILWTISITKRTHHRGDESPAVGNLAPQSANQPYGAAIQSLDVLLGMPRCH